MERCCCFLKKRLKLARRADLMRTRYAKGLVSSMADTASSGRKLRWAAVWRWRTSIAATAGCVAWLMWDPVVRRVVARLVPGEGEIRLVKCLDSTGRAVGVRTGKSVAFYFWPDIPRIVLQFGLTACFFIGPCLFFLVRSTQSDAPGPARAGDWYNTLHSRLVGPYITRFGSTAQQERFMPGCEPWAHHSQR